MDTVPVQVNQHARKSLAPKGPKSKLKVIILSAAGVLVFAALVVGGLLLARALNASPVDSSKYQAVFLTSGQVYFGKLDTDDKGDYSRLTDVFYIQATESDSEADAQDPQEADATTDLQLIKLGSEVHGPEDEMLINKEQILFVENLKTDGKVSNSISQYYSQLNGGNAN